MLYLRLLHFVELLVCDNCDLFDRLESRIMSLQSLSSFQLIKSEDLLMVVEMQPPQQAVGDGLGHDCSEILRSSTVSELSKPLRVTITFTNSDNMPRRIASIEVSFCCMRRRIASIEVSFCCMPRRIASIEVSFCCMPRRIASIEVSFCCIASIEVSFCCMRRRIASIEVNFCCMRRRIANIEVNFCCMLSVPSSMTLTVLCPSLGLVS